MIACADDYGLREGVDRAILELAGYGKLSAVSCMAALQRCTADTLAALRTHEPSIDLGLHLCLTNEGLPMSTPPASPEAKSLFPSFKALLAQALRGRVDQEQVKSWISAQYQLFVGKTGRAPDFIDGHLHVHQFPGVREALLEFVEALPGGSRPYIRNTRLAVRTLWRHRLPWLKSALLGVYGVTMRRQLRSASIATNEGFAGIYDFRRWTTYRANFPRFVASLPEPNGILVVHPGIDEDWRREEFDVLREFAFPSGNPNRFRR